MLDFFRDVVLDISGIDSQAIKQNRTNKTENKKKYIFTKSTKGIIYFLGVLYLVSGGLSILSSKGSVQIFAGIKFVFLSVIDLAALICISVRNKKTEIASLILIVVFIIIMYSTTMLLI